MRTYTELFRVPEYRPLFAATALEVAASTMRGLALGVLVYAATGSPLLSALSLFGSYFAHVAGAALLMSAADRLPPRAALSVSAIILGLGAAVLAVPGMPIWAMLLIVLGLGLVQSPAGGVRSGLLNEILPEGGYVLGRSVFNMAMGAMQIAGFAAGGVIVAVLSPQGALLSALVLDLMAAAVLWFGLNSRPPRASGRPSVRATWRGNAELWSLPARRHLYIALWVPNGLIVGCEALFIPYAPETSWVLFIAAAFGMLVGDMLVGRFAAPRWRARLTTPLRVLLAVAYLVFVVRPHWAVAAVVAAVASVGFAAGVLLQERLITATPERLQGQALGLHGSGMSAMQAVGATVAGALAQFMDIHSAMTVLAVMSLAVTVYLTPRLRHPAVARPGHG
ncbi:MFS transporter [Sinosporangium siamense]|uniref:Membrane protein n=1 Tax=Sinosporangium siamense TaxID=1367973 RepID=A0A919VBY1_9ACTN|nr:MFS transporter [Sinosporangium siamense]GII97022.1 membrane protein [Sinosporangium siamense]